MFNLIKTTNTIALIFSKERNVVNMKAIRKNSLPYIFVWIIYYAWVVAFTTWWTASPVTEELFSTGLRSMIHSINLLSSAIFVLIMRKEWFVKTARIGALLIISGMSLYLLVFEAPVRVAAVIVIGILLGIVNISILIPFVFALNNTEKLYSVVGSNVFINVILLIQHGFLSNKQMGSQEQLASFVILVIALSATLFFKQSSVADVNQNNKDIPLMKRRIYLTLVYNCAIAVLCKGAGKGVLNIAVGIYGNSISMWYYFGGLAGCVIYLMVYAFSKQAFILLSNIIFSTIAMGFLCNAFITEIPGMAVGFALLLGIGSTIGMINMYYILAVVGKKYNSMRYIRLSILFIGICGGVSGVVLGNLIHSINSFQVSVIASMVSVGFMLLFLMFSPLLAQTQYYKDWAKDTEMMEIDNEHTEMFKKYHLSKREIEVCKLLMEGYTLRQISAMLSIAYSTVNTYCTSAYRKLNINSRTELHLKFKDYIIK